VKALADEVLGFLTEGHIPNPIIHYGKSKLLQINIFYHKKFLKGKEFIF
jgi:hypothetical protein